MSRARAQPGPALLTVRRLDLCCEQKKNQEVQMKAALSVLLLAVIGCMPTATFMRTGEEYLPRIHDLEDIAIYMESMEPERPHTVVGTIIVSPDRNVRNQEAYLNALRNKAAEYGVDGVRDVVMSHEQQREASGGCVSGYPYYHQDDYTVYEVQGKAFVWTD
jgi:hypothetical protein